MILPNFLILGAAKTGTTSLYRYLKQHPQIYMSLAKEPRFFAFEGETLNFKGPGDEQETARTDLDSYCSLFERVTQEKAIGEASTMYLWSEKASGRIHHYIPQAKLIAVLRDPVERAYSNFLHLVEEGREPLNDFALALQQEQARIGQRWWPFWYYQQQGFYYNQLQRYYNYFDKKQIRIYLYEDFKNDFSGLVQDIFEFLEVDNQFSPNLSEKVRQSRSIPKNKTLNSLLTQPNLLKSVVKPLMPEKLRRQIADNLKEQNLVKLKPSAKIRQQLIEVYREDILKLQNLLERDLSKWLEV